MSKEEYEKLQIIKTVEGNEIVEKYYNPITCTMISKVDIDCYKYKQALLDIKEYIKTHRYTNMIMARDEQFGITGGKQLLDIVNKALGDKENE